jgi:hypothetical protein
MPSRKRCIVVQRELRGQDLNLRPSGDETEAGAFRDAP